MRATLLIKAISFKTGKYFLSGNPPRWHKLEAGKPAPRGAPVASHPGSPGEHQSHTMTPDQVERLKYQGDKATTNREMQRFNEHHLPNLLAHAERGDAAAILGDSYGVNTHGKRKAMVANYLLEQMGSPHRVTPGQKVGEHSAVNVPHPEDAKSEALAHVSQDQKQLDIPDTEKAQDKADIAKAKKAKPKKAILLVSKHLKEDSKQGDLFADEKAEDAQLASKLDQSAAGLAMPEFVEGKTASGVVDYYKGIAGKVIEMAANGDKAGIQAMIEAGQKPNSKGKISNTWAGKTENSKRLLALAGQAVGGEVAGVASTKPVAVADKPAVSKPVNPVKAVKVDTRPANEFYGEGSTAEKALRSPEIAKLMREDIKRGIAAGRIPKGTKISVTSDHNSINLRLTAVPEGVPTKNPDREVMYANLGRGFIDPWRDADDAVAQVGKLPRDIERHSPEVQKILDDLTAIHGKYNWDKSDRMTDYYNVNYYGDASEHLKNEQEMTVPDPNKGKLGDTITLGGNTYELQGDPKRWHKVSKDEPKAAEAAPEAAAKEATPEARKAQADKLRKVATALADKANETQTQSRQTNTARRASMAAGIMERAYKDEATAKTLHNIADGIESGKLIHLSGVTSKAQLETLQGALDRAIGDTDKALSYTDQLRNKGREATDKDIENAKIPSRPLWADHSRAKDQALEALKGVKGGTALATNIRRAPDITPEDYAALSRLIGKPKAKDIVGWWADESLARRSRLNRMGINTDQDLRNALTELVGLKAAKKQESKLAKMERDLVGRKVGKEFFPTPAPLAEKMAKLAGIKSGMSVLEPSAGTGRLADAAKAAGGNVDAVEISSELRDILKEKGHNVIADNFEGMKSDKQYDAVMMNPPFSNRQDADHIQSAFDMLKPGGKLVAIAGEGVFSGSDKKAQAFRDWLDKNGATVEKLPEGTFKESGTGANSRLITIEKKTDQAPTEGTRNAEGLVFRGGRWHRDEAVDKPPVRWFGGKPFPTIGTAKGKLEKNPGYGIVEVDGGFELQHGAPELPKGYIPHDLTDQELISTGFLKQHPFNDKWQYSDAGGWSNFKTSSSKENAMKMAKDAYFSTPPKDRITKEERSKRAEKEDFDKTHATWAKKSKAEIDDYIKRLGGVRGVGAEKEFNGNGGRRSGAAVSNEAARTAMDEMMRLERYRDARFGKEEPASAKPDAKDYPSAVEHLKAVQEWRERTGIKNQHEAKQQAKADRYDDRAEKASQEATASAQKAVDMLSVIEPGQPILVGHHSEKRHRALLGRSDNAMRAAVEADKKAAHYSQKAEAARSNTAISSDDEDAIPKLRAKIEEAEKNQEMMKAANKIIRSKTLTNDQKIEKLAGVGLGKAAAQKLMKPDYAGRLGYASFETTNNLANIKRMKGRLEGLEKLEQARSAAEEAGAAPKAFPFDGGKVVHNLDENRLQILFDGKPDASVREKLKRNGFRWSPSQGAWQRQLSRDAHWSAEQALGVKLAEVQASAKPTPAPVPADTKAADEANTEAATPKRSRFGRLAKPQNPSDSGMTRDEKLVSTTLESISAIQSGKPNPEIYKGQIKTAMNLLDDKAGQPHLEKIKSALKDASDKAGFDILEGKKSIVGNESKVQTLLKNGGKEWKSGDNHRIYFNNLHELAGLNGVNFNGETLSKNKAMKIRNYFAGAKFWYDVPAGKFQSSGITADEHNKIRDAVDKPEPLTKSVFLFTRRPAHAQLH